MSWIRLKLAISFSIAALIAQAVGLSPPALAASPVVVTFGYTGDEQYFDMPAGVDTIHFAWAGANKPGIGHYYRVQGPTFLIEFINVQPDAEGNVANHIHAVWRDMAGDFAIPLAPAE